MAHVINKHDNTSVINLANLELNNVIQHTRNDYLNITDKAK